MRWPFHLSGPVPLPPGISDSIPFLRPHSDAEIRRIWRAQLARLNALVRDAEPLQAEWYPHTPPDCASSTGAVNIAALTHLMDQCGLGGGPSCGSCNSFFGFGIFGTAPVGFVPDFEEEIRPTLDTDTIWPDVSDRFRARSRASGFKHADQLWTDALSQQERGGFHHLCLWAKTEHRPDAVWAR